MKPIKVKSLFEGNQDIPLAEKMRPKSIEDIVGQGHLVGENGLIRGLIRADKLTSMIFWGPPGSGKTTLARVIADTYRAEFIEVSAVSMGKAEVRQAIDQALQSKNLGRQTILFVDEIHRFNKAQQDMFLPYVEDGTVHLIGATTENPSFEVIAPLLSRSRVLIFEALKEIDLLGIIDRAKILIRPKIITSQAASLLAKMSIGDARVLLGGLEIAASLSTKVVGKKQIEQAMQQVSARYDKNGEQHYDLISAYIKSMRGSDSRAAMYYLYRMLNAGEDPKFVARRIIIFASEDVGMASPHALTLATSAFQAVERVGLPEAEYALSQATIAMCQAKKSRQVAEQMVEAKGLVGKYPNASVPKHLRNPVTSLMKDLDYGDGYRWEADFKHPDGFLPEGIVR